MRYDTVLSKLGARDENTDRLWIENSFDRLTRNGFVPGTGFTATERLGVGLVITPSVLASTHVSSRRGVAVLSLERSLHRPLHGARHVRVRLCVKSIVVMPRLREVHVARPLIEDWTIEGMSLSTPAGCRSVESGLPMTFRLCPRRIRATLSEANVVYATEVIGNAKPAEVVIGGDPLMVTMAAQFLAAAGYAEDGPVWRR